MINKNRSNAILFAINILLFLTVPNKLVQFLTLTFIFLFSICFLYAKIISKSITVERHISKLKIACREKVEISISVKNHSKLPINVCYIFDDAPYLLVYENKNAGIVTLRPNEVTHFNYSFSAHQRGIYHTGPVKIKTSDPLGLFDVNLEIPNILEIIVRPSRIKLITEPFPGLPQGVLKINNSIYEDITQRKTIRSYINGDEQRRINWRMTAKTSELFTNVYENTYDTSFFVFLNLSEEAYELNSRYYDMEKAIEITASIVEKARELHQKVGFAAFGTDFPYLKPANNQYDIILDLLSVIKKESGTLEYNPYDYYKSQLPNGTIFFVIGPEEVRQYFIKVESNEEKITSENIGVFRRKSIGT